MYEMNAKTTDATNCIQEDVLSLRIKNKRLEQEKCELLGIIQGKDKAIVELEEKNRQLKNEVEDLTAYCNQIGKIKTGVLKLFEHIVAR